MLAVRFHRFGDPGVLSAEEVPEPPRPTSDELLVQVDVSSVNGTDIGLRRGDLREGPSPGKVGIELPAR